MLLPIKLLKSNVGILLTNFPGSPEWSSYWDINGLSISYRVCVVFDQRESFLSPERAGFVLALA